MDREANFWAMALHLSVLAGYAIPLAGLVAPIVIWQVKKNEFPELDEHGRMVVNFLLSMLVYALVSALLCLILVGFVMLLVLAVIAVAFPIIGGIKASHGELWQYPFVIHFLN